MYSNNRSTQQSLTWVAHTSPCDVLAICNRKEKREIQKQFKMMPGQEKMVKEYYEKNPEILDNLRGSIYEEKIIEQIKKIAKVNQKEISKEDAEKLLKNENEKNLKEQEELTKHHHDHKHENHEEKTEIKKKSSPAKLKTPKKAKTVGKKTKTSKKVSKK